MNNIENKRVAILATDGFEESELTSPMKALKENGATVHVVSTDSGKIKSWKDGNWNMEIDVDKTVSDVTSSDYDALVIPGGVINPDKMRRSEKAVQFVRSFFEDHKPVASICHGPQMLIEADVVNGRRMTSFGSISTDLKNAGANWVDEEVVTDQGLVTSRSPEDLDAFNKKMIEEIAEGKHAEQTV
ncbi:MAG TPA: type 1 glutamine amidotransferase domain-containing protein [Cryomorphaceae bacterium]|nr:type 1 glutamine amidotransferase domain-containing protein [Cryomorphaceae bacterium]